MPNYRNKNKGRRQKNRNKKSDQNRNNEEYQQKTKKHAAKPEDAELLLQHREYHQQQIGCVPNMFPGRRERSSCHYDLIGDRCAPPTAAIGTPCSNPRKSPANDQRNGKTAAAANIEVDTVSCSTNDAPINVTAPEGGKNNSLISEMGASSSKGDPTAAAAAADDGSDASAAVCVTPQQGKVIVHRVVTTDEVLTSELHKSDPKRTDNSSSPASDPESDSNIDDLRMAESAKSNPDHYKQRRAEKRAAIESHFLPQYLNPRYLDSIVEESEKSDTAPSRSGSCDFGDGCSKEAAAKRHTLGSEPASGGAETPPTIVEARLIEQPATTEGCAVWSSVKNPDSEVAEVVYIDSASSSVSDLLELDYEEHSSAKQLMSLIDLDTDVTEILGHSSKASQGKVKAEHLKTSNEQLLNPTPVETTSPTQRNELKCNTNEQLLHRLITASGDGALAAASDEKSSAAENSESAESDSSYKSSASCVSLVNSDAPSFGILAQSQMNDIREILNDAAKESSANASPSKNHIETEHVECSQRSISPSTEFSRPVEPVTSTENSGKAGAMNHLQNHTDFSHTTQTHADADAPADSNSFLPRQDSAESCGSGSSNSCQSRCTAINTHLHDPLLICDCANSDVESSVSGSSSQAATTDGPSIKKLRMLCTETLASLPHGEEILLELAKVAQNIGELRAAQGLQETDYSMPYPLPTLPHISDLQISMKQASNSAILPKKGPELSPLPPPVPEPPKTYNCWLGVPTESDPKLLVCLSPSQRFVVGDYKAAGGPDRLLDAHQKFIQRRGYHEYTTEQVEALDLERAAENEIIQTTSMMRQLRKCLTPPPVVPPPRGPPKLSDIQPTKQTAQNCGNGREQHRLLAIIHDDSSELQQHQLRPENSSGPAKNTLEAATTEKEKIDPKEQMMYEQKLCASEQSKNHESRKEFEQKSRNPATQIKFPIRTAAPSTATESEEEKFPKSRSETTKDDLDSVQKRHSTRHSEVKTSKRYSNVETSRYESTKRIENGRVVYDTENSTRESFTDGEPLHFPLAASAAEEQSKWLLHTSKSKPTSIETVLKTTCNPKVIPNADEIMSPLILNGQRREAPTSNGAASLCADSRPKIKEINTNEDAQAYRIEVRVSKNKQSSDSTHREHVINISKEPQENEKFRRRAKEEEEEEDVESSSAEMTTTIGNSKPKTTFNWDHDQLFKDFDDLSSQLNKELSSSKLWREQRERSASLYDLSRLQSESKTRFEELKSSRLQHMQELEQEIERSQLSRRFRKIQETTPRPNDSDQIRPRTFQIPIRIEADNPQPSTVVNNGLSGSGVPPIDVEPSKCTTAPLQKDFRRNGDLQRRAESMFDLSGKQMRAPAADDWTRYAGDLGSSENITRPFAKEVEICYKRCKPNGIRAPRLTASTHELPAECSYDSNAVLNRGRTHAPMLSTEQAVPQSSRRYFSCQSMIEQDPNPAYISTTARPASANASLTPTEKRRRASLPREIHEQQLSYIANKEKQLKTEFERLQTERQRLLEEFHRVPKMMSMQTTRSKRDAQQRPASKLPTLSEEEVFRQQMAEEWLSKVAEREDRRSHKIIKVSKINEETKCGCTKNDIGNEFLQRVQERRSKLEMPSDSDWESGAESHPAVQGHASETDEGSAVKVVDGRTETDMRQLPKHLREFAQFSSHQIEEIAGKHSEMHHEEEFRQENSARGAVKKQAVTKAYKICQTTAEKPSEQAVDGTEFPPSTTFVMPKFASRMQTTPSFGFAVKGPSPAAFSEMFAASPFKSHISEQFENYWQHFEFE